MSQPKIPYIPLVNHLPKSKQEELQLLTEQLSAFKEEEKRDTLLFNISKRGF
ncbi:hypothetical protein [Flagellimonas flava]|uniref:Uncharacterized protein n=1 Tax=Flagellimonas flava TaxID=570519 RepID=A0A1M5KYL6_9FLAO|nr:hypothetical protein [Allomuricauda flava]SHG57898.1 hypothetical protein SAMN04488116_1859 [Allomuricauda flava]